MTVNEYAEKKGVSVQSVYGKIKRGTLETRELDGVMHIIEPGTFNGIVSGDKSHLTDRLNKVSKKLQKERNKRLKAVHKRKLAEVQLNSIQLNIKSKDEEIATLKHVIEKYERMFGKNNLQLTAAPGEDHIIDIKPKKKKKKK